MDDQLAEYDAIIEGQFHHPTCSVIEYNASYSKSDFLRYLSRKRYLLHGAKSMHLELAPALQTTWDGEPVTAVFATEDGIWPVFFPVLNRERLHGSIRIGCFVVEASPARTERFYFFSIPEEPSPHLWTDGFVHILSKEGFEPTTAGPIHFDEWANREKVRVIAWLPVSPSDLPFLGNVVRHSEKEEIATTWFHYKQRQGITLNRYLKPK